MNMLSKKLSNFMFDEEGASAVEYGLLAALIAAVIIGALTSVGGKLKTTFIDVSKSLK